jgi:hypothetical protein
MIKYYEHYEQQYNVHFNDVYSVDEDKFDEDKRFCYWLGRLEKNWIFVRTDVENSEMIHTHFKFEEDILRHLKYVLQDISLEEHWEEDEY